MSISATKILLATDGSEEAELAARTAAALAGDTDSELHVVTVGPFLPTIFVPMEEEPARMAREARRTLDEQVGLIEAAGGGSRRPTSGWEEWRRRSWPSPRTWVPG